MQGMDELRRGWPVLAGAMASAGAGIFIFATVNGFFIDPLVAAFSWTRGQVSLSSSAVLLTGLAMPFVGALVDRYGPERFILIGAGLFALGYAALALMPGDFATYLAIMFFIGIAAGPATAPLVVTRPLVTAFERSRGLALAIGMSGGMLICIALLPALQNVIAVSGWRAGYALMAAVSLVAGIASFLLLRAGARRIAACREAAGADATTLHAPIAHGATFAQALRDPRFWLLGVSIICISMVDGALAAHLQPLLADLRVPGGSAALLGSLFAASVVVGRIATGLLLDRFWPPLVGTLAICGPVLGLPMFLAAEPGMASLVVATTLVGLSSGAEGDMLAFFTARYFGLRSFGTIFGTLGMLYGLAVAAAGMGAGYGFDVAGSYRPMLAIGTVLAATGAAALFLAGLLRPTPPGEPTRDARA